MSSSAQVDAFLNGQASKQPELAELFAELRSFYERKLWHELTMKLEEAVALPAFQQGDLLIQLYHNFLVDFEHRISPLKLGHLAVAVSSRYTDRAAAVAFMEQVVEKIAEQRQHGHEEPVLYLRMHVALLHVHEGRSAQAREMVRDGKGALDAMASPDPSVSAAYYYVCSQYHKAKQEFAEFYRHGMLYLAFVSSESLPEATRRDLAADLALAALLGEDLYNFAELIAQMEELQQELVGRIRAGVDYKELHLDTHRLIAGVLVESGLASGDADTLLQEGVTSAFMPHGIGHLLGIQVHDVAGFMENESGTTIDPPSGHPFLRLTRVLEEDMVLTIEPGLYVIDMLLDNLRGSPAENQINWAAVDRLRPFGGVRIEDNVRVLPDGSENMTRDAFAA